jgi:hypothetical protein
VSKTTLIYRTSQEMFFFALLTDMATFCDA